MNKKYIKAYNKILNDLRNKLNGATIEESEFFRSHSKMLLAELNKKYDYAPNFEPKKGK